MSVIEPVAGIDCGKCVLDVAVFPGPDKLRVVNTPAGHQAVVAWLARRGVGIIGLEASGGYERPVRDALHAAGLAVCNPARVRFYAKALGRRAKSDPIDAAVIALFTASPAAPAAGSSTSAPICSASGRAPRRRPRRL